ncbi:hypothetical protein D9758_013810 [Tetrapyrgos nigripes]|uniref:Uncharacterized protein n=1 Tax=Tetrapyrgos nigripes TaxID=182062 RepID=A0A8H5FSW7_9AGAR|nr:hypothetical protein D9758_013810 [Tetrapyrgos nigripes]
MVITRSKVQKIYMVDSNLLHSHQPDIPNAPDGNTLRTLSAKQIFKMHQLSQWSLTNNGYQLQLQTLDTSAWTQSAKRNLNKISEYLKKLKISHLLHGSTDLLLSRTDCQLQAERQIRLLAGVSSLKPSPSSNDNFTWASDGSMIPVSAGLFDQKSILSAITGPRTLVLKVTNMSASITHGELLGLVLGSLLSKSLTQTMTSTLHSDALYCIQTLENCKMDVNQLFKLRHMNGRSYYRWILDINNRNDISIKHVKAHTEQQDAPSILNFEADYYASKSQCHHYAIPAAPVPTFFMNPFTMYSNSLGWIESSSREYTE